MNSFIYTSFYLTLLFFQFCTPNPDGDDCEKRFLTNCCKGYHLANNECIPICKNGCPESQQCVKPNVCGFETPDIKFMRDYCGKSVLENNKNYCGMCFPTHIPYGNPDCKPYCTQKFANGIRDSSGVICACDPGYRENLKRNSCEPIDFFTPEDCNKGNCENVHRLSTIEMSSTSNLDSITLSTTDVTDLSTHTQVSTSNYKFMTNCQKMCQNGVCNQDDICECKQGYVFANASSGCVPQCDRECINSTCVTEVEKCLKGICDTVHKCQCHIGFLPNPNDPFECVPASLIESEQSKWLTWIFIILSLTILILLGNFLYKRMRRVTFDVQKAEKQKPHDFVEHEQFDCVL